jgi:hypothetical protein
MFGSRHGQRGHGPGGWGVVRPVLLGLLSLLAVAGTASAQTEFWGDSLPFFWTSGKENQHGRPFVNWTVVNTGTAPAVVNVEGAAGIEAVLNIPPGDWRTFTEYAPTANVGFPPTPRKTTEFVHRFSSTSSNLIVHQFSLPRATSLMSEASTLLPATSLGLDYTIVTSGYYTASKTQSVVVIATKDQTTVQITPYGTAFQASNPAGGFTQMDPGLTTTLTLNKFESLRLLSKQGEVIGSRIQSDKPVAVFAAIDGSKPVQQMGLNQIQEQVYPVQHLGKEYVNCAAAQGSGFDMIRIVATEAGTTKVTIDPAPSQPS